MSEVSRLKKYDKLICLDSMPESYNIKAHTTHSSLDKLQTHDKSSKSMRRKTGRSHSSGEKHFIPHDMESSSCSNKSKSQVDNEEEEEEVDTGIEETDGPPGSKRRLADVFPILER